MHIGNGDSALTDEIMLFEYVKNLGSFKLFMLSVGNILAEIAEMLSHSGGKNIAVSLLKQIADSALAALRIDPDDIRIVCAADIVRIDGDIGNIPAVKILFFSVFHALCDCVLMAARECGENKCSRIRRTLIDMHSFRISQQGSAYL